MNDIIIGTINYFGFTFTPSGWAQCNGQLMSIAQNQVLFALLGTTYGGDGVTTFGMPDLRGRSIVHPGQGRGLSNIGDGQMSGTESTTLLITNLPMHTHDIKTITAKTIIPTTSGGVTNETDGNTLSFGSGGSCPNIYSEATPDPKSYVGGVRTTFTGNPQIAGGNQPTGITSPYLAINTCICLAGIFPSRN